MKLPAMALCFHRVCRYRMSLTRGGWSKYRSQSKATSGRGLSVVGGQRRSKLLVSQVSSTTGSKPAVWVHQQ